MHVIIILVVYSCVLDVTYYRPRCSFSAASCPTFVAFLEPPIQSAIDRLLPTPAHRSKALQTIESVRGLCCVHNLLTVEDKHWRYVWKAESANSLPFACNGVPFMWGAYFCLGAYKRRCCGCVKNGAYIHGCFLSRFYGKYSLLASFVHLANVLNAVHRED